VTAPENELLQWKATRLLFDAWYRAVYLAAHGTFEIQDSRWVIDKTERRRGNAIRVLGAIQSMVPDSEIPSAPVDTHAEITLTELANVEVFEVPEQ
jgi:hypothetical protein